MSRLIVLVLLVAASACAPKGTPVDAEDRRIDEPAVEATRNADDTLPDWFPRAVDVRVHPASRYVRERDILRLEARIELIDQFNEPIKDVGTMVMEMRIVDRNGQLIFDAEGRQRGFRWSRDLTTQASQEEYWDPIARAYVLPLEIKRAEDADFPEHRTVLTATFVPAWPGKPTIPEGEPEPVEIRTDW